MESRERSRGSKSDASVMGPRRRQSRKEGAPGAGRRCGCRGVSVRKAREAGAKKAQGTGAGKARGAGARKARGGEACRLSC